jgi:uncharacterized membrane protein
VIHPQEIIIGVISLIPLLILFFRGKFLYFSLAAIIAICIQGTYFFGPQILYLLLFTYIISTIGELICLKTPVRCFGIKYWYHPNKVYFSSGIRILNVYPIEVTFAWVILKYLSFCLATLITQAFYLPQLLVLLLTPLILVSLDLIIDPVSVHIYKLWSWERGSGYFGIPWQNFLGWYLYGFLATFLFGFVARSIPVTFHPVYLLPILYYGSFLTNTPPILKRNKTMAIFGSLPALIWTLLGVLSLLLLFFRR